tara:strand:- start:58 stop:678 length:621 start_codon:yes stop_codon:yes gene_type:complete
MPSRFIRRLAILWIDGILLFLKIVCKIDYEIIGLENIPKHPSIIASKHQSTFETLLLFKVIKNSIFIHKKELFYIPIFGLYLKKINMISINRAEGSKSMRKMLNKVKQNINNGFSIIIFPEGTRKKPGQIAEYKTGIAGIYKESETSVLPVAVNSGIYWPKNTFIKKSGKIIIKLLKPLPPKLKKSDFLKKIELDIESETNKIIKF